MRMRGRAAGETERPPEQATRATKRAACVLAALSLLGCGGSAKPAGLVSHDDERRACDVLEVGVVAHPDDDLLFFNPDVMRAVRAGHCVTTVVLTAGDAGHDAPYWRAREEGLRAAYARMARAKDAWRDVSVEGGAAAVFEVVDAPRVRLAFMRLPDGNVDGHGFDSTGHASLERSWLHPNERIESLDHSRTFTRAELVGAIAAVLLRDGVHPSLVRTLDGTDIYRRPWAIDTEHSDHAHAALFAGAAAARFSLRTLAYRDYNISSEPPNLEPAETAEKREVFLTYARSDGAICERADVCKLHEVYEAWLPRRYPLAGDPFPEGALVALGYRCVAVSRDVVSLAACDSATEVAWHWGEDGTLRSASGACLGAPEDAREGTPVARASCEAPSFVPLRSDAEGRLAGPSSLCAMPSDAKTAVGTPLVLGVCKVRRSQQFVLHHRASPTTLK